MRTGIVQIGIVALLAVGAAACSSGVEPENGNVRVEAAMESSRIAYGKAVAGEEIAGAGATVDSLRISSIALLIKELKLESKGVTATEIKVKTGPAILSVDSAGSRLTMTATIPPATYNKVKIQFHRLEDRDRDALSGSPDFADFLTNDRYSVVIKGTVYDNGQASAFTWGGKLEQELKLDMADVNITQNGMVVIVIRIDPVLSFKDSRMVLDPRDPDNHGKIEEALKRAIKAVKKG